MLTEKALTNTHHILPSVDLTNHQKQILEQLAAFIAFLDKILLLV